MARVTNQDLQVQLTELKVMLNGHLREHETSFNRLVKITLPATIFAVNLAVNLAGYLFKN